MLTRCCVRGCETLFAADAEDFACPRCVREMSPSKLATMTTIANRLAAERAAALSALSDRLDGALDQSANA